MAAIVTNRAKKLFGKGAIAWKASGGTALAIALVTSSNNFDVDTNLMSDGTLGELSGTGYTAGYSNKGAAGAAARQALTLYDATEDDSGNISVLRADRCTWTAINAGTVAKGVIYTHGGTIDGVAVTADSDAHVIAIVDISPTVATNGGNFTFKFANDDATKGDVITIS